MLRYINLLSKRSSITKIKPQFLSTNPTVLVGENKEKESFSKNDSEIDKFLNKTAQLAFPKNIPSNLEKKISSAKDVDELLSFVTKPFLSRKNALHIFTILNEWNKTKKINLSDYEKDENFLALSKKLGTNTIGRKSTSTSTTYGDLALFLGANDEDEAAKLISTISITQMIKILTSLAQQKKRSIPILRSLVHNISEKPYKLTIKEGTDLLYATAVLNFPDEQILQKTCSDLIFNIRDNTNPKLIKSIITSLGYLKYKNTELLDCLSNWIHGHLHLCTSRDILSFLMTLASLGYNPSNEQAIFQALDSLLVEQEMTSSIEWLQVVWTLVILRKANHNHLSTVLSPDFIKKIKLTVVDQKDIPVPLKLKLLNINGAAKYLIKDYKGPQLDLNSEEWKVPLKRNKDKSVLVSSIFDSFSNLFSSEYYLKTNIDTQMGFLLDAECCLDERLNPLPVNNLEKIKGHPRKISRIGILIWDYNDMCRGQNELRGMGQLIRNILNTQDYKLLEIPYTEFSPSEKILTRVKYLENKLKELARN